MSTQQNSTGAPQRNTWRIVGILIAMLGVGSTLLTVTPSLSV